MKNRGGLYSGLDIPEFYALVEMLFTPEEAQVNNAMPSGHFMPSQIAGKLGKSEGEVAHILDRMADKALCRTVLKNGVRCYKAEPMMPGILEFQLMSGKSTEREKKVARLIRDYKKAYEASQGTVKLTYPRSRVITVDRTVAAGNTIHTYDQVSTYIEKNEAIAVATCYCRHLGALLGEDTHGMPMEACMWFSELAEFAVERLGARKVSKQEAMGLLKECEEAGLVHMSRNVIEDIEFLCNCDRWHCRAMKIALDQPKPSLFFNSGFEPRFDPELCTGCETCIERCPPSALAIGDEGTPEPDLDRCFGCAVCATGCPSEAIRMVAKRGVAAPPKDVWALGEAVKAGLS